GGHFAEQGTITLFGERPARSMPGGQRSGPGSTIGVVAQLAGGRLQLLTDAPSCSRLRGVTRLTTGALVACGDWGAVARIEMGVVEHIGSICGGHLNALAPLPDGGAVTVGVGGHALHLSPRLEAQLEAVQTTRDLFALTIGDDGA